MGKTFYYLIICTVLLALFTLMTGTDRHVAADDTQVTFGVGWYDVVKAALEGRRGIEKVTRGWKGMTEINTVYYDPAKITIAEMERVLRQAGTYKKTFK